MKVADATNWVRPLHSGTPQTTDRPILAAHRSMHGGDTLYLSSTGWPTSAAAPSPDELPAAFAAAVLAERGGRACTGADARSLHERRRACDLFCGRWHLGTARLHARRRRVAHAVPRLARSLCRAASSAGMIAHRCISERLATYRSRNLQRANHMLTRRAISRGRPAIR